MEQAKLHFFTDASHEFRTPLSLIVGPIEELRNEQELPLPVRVIVVRFL
ncbi:histidine kinase dimerization/phospho-acceptor domain-containing protein [Spirosoma panaciterrae]